MRPLPLSPLPSKKGFVRPSIPDGAAAAVFAIYSDARALQVVAFSTDLRRSLLTVLGRRPDKAYYYKCVVFHFFRSLLSPHCSPPIVGYSRLSPTPFPCSHRAHFFPAVDQPAMAAARDAWFGEVGGAPPGNKLALERAAWTAPVPAGAISARGQRAAAEGKAADLAAALRTRGCLEDLVPDERLLNEGQVDFVPAAELTAEQTAAAAVAAETAAAGARTLPLPGLDPPAATVRTLATFPANGGTFFDIALAYDSLETKHRVIVGSGWHSPQGAPPDAALDAALTFLIRAGADLRRTEGILSTPQFNSNYFSLGEVDQRFPGFSEYLATHGLGPNAPRAAGVSEAAAAAAAIAVKPWSFSRKYAYGDRSVAVPEWGADDGSFI